MRRDAHVDGASGGLEQAYKGVLVHRAGHPIATTRDAMFHRETDDVVQAIVRKRPFEVGANWIARTAHRALELLGEIRKLADHPIPLVWGDLHGLGAIEVYPGATLKAHGLDDQGYKGNETKHRDKRRALVAMLAKTMTFEVEAERLYSNDDRLDAAVCVLAGADYLRGDVVRPTARQRKLGEREGWIWVRAPR